MFKSGTKFRLNGFLIPACSKVMTSDTCYFISERDECAMEGEVFGLFRFRKVSLSVYSSFRFMQS